MQGFDLEQIFDLIAEIEFGSYGSHVFVFKFLLELKFDLKAAGYTSFIFDLEI